MSILINQPENSGTSSLFQEINQTKKQLNFKTYRKNLLFLTFFSLLFAVKPASAQMDMKFGTYSLKSGTDKQQGAKYLYKNVATGFDCIVTIAQVSGGATLYAFDDSSLVFGGTKDRFQPIITAPYNDYNTNYVRFRFQLILSNTYSNGSGTIAVPTDPIWFRSYDVDGNGSSNGLKEFVELGTAFTGSWVDDPSELVAATPLVTGEKRYMISSATINGDDISDLGKYAFNGFIYGGTTSTWEIVGGSYVGNCSPNPNGPFNDADRLNSWSFCKDDIDPAVDFGDAPSSYNGSNPTIPAFHVVPSVDNCRKLYLGTVKPDYDFDPSGNIAANVDDLNKTLDDEDGITYKYFPKYGGTGTYSTTVKATNVGPCDAYLYAYIDFNGDGDFNDAGERSAKVTVNNTSTTYAQTLTVTFTGITSYNTTNANRYVRFRLAYDAADVDTPNGAAYSGEVEDYRFDIARDISGIVHLDADGLTDGAIDGPGIGNPSGTQIYAILVNADGKVVQSVAVNTTTGAYTLAGAGTNNTFTVLISTTAGTVGSAAPSPALPTNWVFTGEGYGTGDGTPNGSISGILNNTQDNITGNDFGIEQRPVAVSKSITSIGNLGGTNNYTVPANTFVPTDADGVVNYISIATFPTNVTSITITSIVVGVSTTTKYTSSTWPAGGVDSIPYNSGNPSILVDPVDGNATATISYKAVDNANVNSNNTGVISLEFKVVSISGKVWDDANGDAVIQTTEAVYNGSTSTTLYAYLVDASNKVVQAATVSSTGTYTFTNAPYNTAGYKIVISTVTAATGAVVGTATLPANYVTTGETIGTTKEGTPDSKITIPASNTALSDYNFGIERLPETVDRTYSMGSIALNANYTLASVPLKGSDPEDSPAAGSISTGGSFKITQLPATGVTLLYNNIAVVFNQVITSYDPAKLAIKYTAQVSSTTFKYATIDAAGQLDPTPATYILSYATVLPLNGLELSANLQGSNVKLTWNVTGERNVARYELEYSNDGRTFNALNTTAYRASSNATNAYTYTHLPVVTSGILYYRVIQVRTDGSTSISNQVSVRLNDKNAPFVTVMPTLITDMANIRIHAVSAGKTVINIVDNNGKLVMKKEVSLAAGTTTLTMDGWQALATGTYYVQVSNSDEQSSVKVIVQH